MRLLFRNIVSTERFQTWRLNNKVVLFKCYRFNHQRGMKVHPKNGIVEIKHKSRAFKYDPFILMEMVEQVYYLPYVCKSKHHKDWWVFIKTKVRSRVDWTHIENIIGDEDTIDVDDIIQEDFQMEPLPTSQQMNSTTYLMILTPKSMIMMSPKKTTPMKMNQIDYVDYQDQVDNYVDDEDQVEDYFEKDD
ncbi:hypothetical protein LIER_01751 [Lithospermum erythrorhizon]|uniref:DUF4216 domain-containing protein n=1 Tax=Lithospermum erythrorhizon TaxID=34254 RepID=A0AAV3NM27_LITER